MGLRKGSYSLVLFDKNGNISWKGAVIVIGRAEPVTRLQPVAGSTRSCPDSYPHPSAATREPSGRAQRPEGEHRQPWSAAPRVKALPHALFSGRHLQSVMTSTPS